LKIFAPIFVTACMIFCTSSAFSQSAGAAESFLASLSGDYRGRGQVVLPFKSDREPVSCRVSNNYNAGSKALQVKGNCATAQGRNNVSGKLSVKDRSVVGNFLSPFSSSQITKSSSSFSGGRLVVSTSLVNKNTGNLTRVRQIVTRSRSGFISTFQRYDNASKAYKNTGTVRFTKAGS